MLVTIQLYDLEIGPAQSATFGVLEGSVELEIPELDTSFDHAFGVHHQTSLDFDSATINDYALICHHITSEGSSKASIADYKPSQELFDSILTVAIAKAKHLHTKGEL